MSDPESIEALDRIRSYLNGVVQGVNFIPGLPMAQKVMAVREAVALQGHTWDEKEGVLWAEMIEYIEAGRSLTDDHLIDWRHRYRTAIDLE